MAKGSGVRVIHNVFVTTDLLPQMVSDDLAWLDAQRAQGRDITVGCLINRGWVEAGIKELDTAAGEFIYPTTTPASFDPDEAHKAVDRVMACNPQQLYLTHFSRVTDLERLARDMHDGIDAFVAMALEHRDAEDRGRRIEEAMFEHLAQRLEDHGLTGVHA